LSTARTKKAAKPHTKAAPKKAAHPEAPPAETPDPPANAPTPTRPGLNDRRGDNDAVVGQFVDVVAGEFEGRYGVFLEAAPDGHTAIVRTRDADSVRISTDIDDLRPAQAGRR
jgi:hypothetical protein